jgi:hypothetical protein
VERFTGSTRSITVAESETQFAASIDGFEILENYDEIADT